ncbi:MAG: cupin domain-containing protein [Kiritimatiellales bacterium]|nr:cupin domain-containing protein [Kiritimatiellales bacterium]
MSSIPIKINLSEYVDQLNKPWSPIDIARFNDQVLRLAMFEGEFNWHQHEEDELFMVVRGEITIQMCDQADMVLTNNEFGIIPKGVEHCPRSDGQSFVLMVEPASLQSQGD